MNNEAMKRERWQADVVIVGGGVAGCSTAIRLLQRVNEHNSTTSSEPLDVPQVIIIEKSAEIGNHVLSGAVVDPVPITALFPDFRERNAPVDTEVKANPFYYFSKTKALRLPFTPPGMGSKGCFLTSLSRFTAWMAGQAETLGAQIFAGFAANELLRDGAVVKGVRLGDKGIDKHGNPLPNALFGDEIEAKVTVLAGGANNTLAKTAIREFGLGASASPQSLVLGIKEIVELPEERIAEGTALHTFGFPHDSVTYGGGFVYWRPGGRAAICLATGLDYRDPRLDPHELFLQWKSHPFLKKLLEGGNVVEYGAKTIPEGGYFAVPKLAADGLVIVGDSAGLLNSVRLKGAHLAIQSGMDAADAVFDSLRAKAFGSERLEEYPRRFFAGWAGRELRRVRNLHQPFHLHQIAGMAGIGLHTATFGLLPAGRLGAKPDADALRPVTGNQKPPEPAVTGKDPLMLDKLSDVFLSGTVHEEDQRSHITILDTKACSERCKAEFDCPCTRFCPAQVYEWLEEERRIKVNFTNCLHCQTCEDKDPLHNISWNLPEGGGGPRYKNM